VPIVTTSLIIKINEIKQLKSVLSLQSRIIANDIILNDVKRIVKSNFSLLKDKKIDIASISEIPFNIEDGPEILTFKILEKKYTFYINNKTQLDKTRLYLNKVFYYFRISNPDVLSNYIVSGILEAEFDKDKLLDKINKYQIEYKDEQSFEIINNIDRLFQFDNNNSKNSFYKTDELFLSILLSETIKSINEYKKIKKNKLFRTMDKQKIFDLKKQKIFIREKPNKKHIISIIIKYKKYETWNNLLFDFTEGQFIETYTNTKFRYY
jgi:hypothetical protein